MRVRKIVVVLLSTWLVAGCNNVGGSNNQKDVGKNLEGGQYNEKIFDGSSWDMKYINNSSMEKILEELDIPENTVLTLNNSEYALISNQDWERGYTLLEEEGRNNLKIILPAKNTDTLRYVIRSRFKAHELVDILDMISRANSGNVKELINAAIPMAEDLARMGYTDGIACLDVLRGYLSDEVVLSPTELLQFMRNFSKRIDDHVSLLATGRKAITAINMSTGEINLVEVSYEYSRLYQVKSNSLFNYGFRAPKWTPAELSHLNSNGEIELYSLFGNKAGYKMELNPVSKSLQPAIKDVRFGKELGFRGNLLSKNKSLVNAEIVGVEDSTKLVSDLRILRNGSKTSYNKYAWYLGAGAAAAVGIAYISAAISDAAGGDLSVSDINNFWKTLGYGAMISLASDTGSMVMNTIGPTINGGSGGGTLAMGVTYGVGAIATAITNDNSYFARSMEIANQVSGLEFVGTGLINGRVNPYAAISISAVVSAALVNVTFYPLLIAYGSSYVIGELIGGKGGDFVNSVTDGLADTIQSITEVFNPRPNKKNVIHPLDLSFTQDYPTGSAGYLQDYRLNVASSKEQIALSGGVNICGGMLFMNPKDFNKTSLNLKFDEIAKRKRDGYSYEGPTGREDQHIYGVGAVLNSLPDFISYDHEKASILFDNCKKNTTQIHTRVSLPSELSDSETKDPSVIIPAWANDPTNYASDVHYGSKSDFGNLSSELMLYSGFYSGFISFNETFNKTPAGYTVYSGASNGDRYNIARFILPNVDFHEKSRRDYFIKQREIISSGVNYPINVVAVSNRVSMPSSSESSGYKLEPTGVALRTLSSPGTSLLPLMKSQPVTIANPKSSEIKSEYKVDLSKFDMSCTALDKFCDGSRRIITDTVTDSNAVATPGTVLFSVIATGQLDSNGKSGIRTTDGQGYFELLVKDSANPNINSAYLLTIPIAWRNNVPNINVTTNLADNISLKHVTWSESSLNYTNDDKLTEVVNRNIQPVVSYDHETGALSIMITDTSQLEVPEGSYLDRQASGLPVCENAYWGSDDKLYAYCDSVSHDRTKPINPVMKLYSLDYKSQCNSGSEVNVNLTPPSGVYSAKVNSLQCTSPKILPKGNYLEKCSNVGVDNNILSALCKDGDKAQLFKMNYAACAAGSGIDLVSSPHKVGEIATHLDCASGAKARVPSGNYLSSCSEIRFDGVGNLIAQCGKSPDSAEEVMLNYRKCFTNDNVNYDNNTGQLSCARGDMNQNIPKGNYLSYCKKPVWNKEGLLETECAYRDTSPEFSYINWANTTLTLDYFAKCAANSTVSLIGREVRLGCDKAK